MTLTSGHYTTTSDLYTHHEAGYYYACDAAGRIRGAGRTASDALDDAALNLCHDTPPYGAISAYVDVPLDGPSEDEEGGEGGEPPPDEALAWERLHAACIDAAHPLGGEYTPRATPLLARQEMPGYYYALGGWVCFRDKHGWQRTIRAGRDWERAERLAARLNAMRCREVAV